MALPVSRGVLEVVEDVQDVPHSPRLLFDLRRELKTRHGDRLQYERVKGHAVTRERQTASLETSHLRAVSHERFTVEEPVEQDLGCCHGDLTKES